jgi:uncharacterized protein YegL
VTDNVLGMTDEDLGTGDPRCPLVLLLDTSSSMGSSPDPEVTDRPIDQLNRGLATLAAELKEDPVARRRVEVLVVPFGGAVNPVGDFTLAWDWQPPTLSASGGTPMGAAVRYGLDAASARRRVLQGEGTVTYRPWVFLLTDGAPTDSMSGIPEAVASAEQGKQAVFWCVSSIGADEGVLRTLTPDKPILRLDKTDWGTLFKWLSAAMSSVSRSSPGDQTTLPPWTITA